MHVHTCVLGLDNNIYIPFFHVFSNNGIMFVLYQTGQIKMIEIRLAYSNVEF